MTMRGIHEFLLMLMANSLWLINLHPPLAMGYSAICYLPISYFLNTKTDIVCPRRRRNLKGNQVLPNGLIGCIIEIAKGIGHLIVNRRRNDPGSQVLRWPQPRYARRAEAMSHHGFDRYGKAFCPLSENPFDPSCLGNVIERSGRFHGR